MFNNSVSSIPKLLDKVIALSLGWLKAKKSRLFLGLLVGGRAFLLVWISANCFVVFGFDSLTLCIFGSFFGIPCAIGTACLW